jgi:hypothetical protein
MGLPNPYYNQELTHLSMMLDQPNKKTHVNLYLFCTLQIVEWFDSHYLHVEPSRPAGGATKADATQSETVKLGCPDNNCECKDVVDVDDYERMAREIEEANANGEEWNPQEQTTTNGDQEKGFSEQTSDTQDDKSQAVMEEEERKALIKMGTKTYVELGI